MKPQNIIFGIFAFVGTIFMAVDSYIIFQSIGKEGTWEEVWLLPMIFGLFTLIFGSIGYIGLWVSSKPDRMKQELVVLGKGRKVTIPIGEVTQNFSFRVNGRSPFIIIGQYHDKVSNTIYQFKSESIWYNPTPYMEGKKEVDVYIDPNDMKRYYLDISFLPKQG